MKMTAIDQRETARRAYWNFNIRAGLFDQFVVYTGDGVDDLDGLTARLSSTGTNPYTLWQLDVGSQYSRYVPFDLEDLAAIRAYYIGFYGTTAKPPLVQSPPVDIEVTIV